MAEGKRRRETDRRRRILQKQVRPVFDSYFHALKTRLIGILLGVFVALLLLVIVGKPVVDSLIGEFLLISLAVVAMVIGAVGVIVVNRRLSRKFGAICNVCQRSLFSAARPRGRDVVTESQIDGWRAMDVVPLRCPNCGAFIEEYLTQELGVVLDENRSR